MSTTAEAPQRMEFKTELKQLLDLIVHSLYTKKEIFLRELISNAADAIDKARFESLTNPDLLEGDGEWKIKIIANEADGTLTIRDNGIGMNRESIVEHLGTIARSGTKQFVENLRKAQAQNVPELIGQFGVGFYASFMAADRVTVLSRSAGDKAAGVRWESDGQGEFTVEPYEQESRGTEVILHLRDDAKEFLKEWRIREIVKAYSDFIDHPIVIDVEREKDGNKTVEEETLNSRKAIWLRPKTEVKPEEYETFYQQISRDHDKPLKTIHVAAEGQTEFKALMFIPSHRPMDWMFAPEAKSGLDLYVKRVLIQHNCEQLVPTYLRFVRGVVDSADLPLNVSRETLQHHPLLAKIKSNVVNRILKTLDEMKAGEWDDYVKFFKEFGAVLKEGVGIDFSNRERLADLLLFETTKTKPGGFTTLEKYITNMPAEQKEIYFIVGEGRAQIENAPQLESFKAKGFEVLLLTDPIDEYVVGHLHEYKGKTLKAADKGKLEDAGDEEKLKAATEKLKGVLETLKSKLADEVKAVRLSSRLKESAACLVADDHAMSAHMERLMQRMGHGGEIPPNKRILELNPEHAVVQSLQKLSEANPNDPRIDTFAQMLHAQAVLAEGSKLKDPAAFAKRLNELMVNATT